MQEKGKKDHPILFSIMLGVALTFLVSIASAIAIILKLDDRGLMLTQASAFLIFAIIITIYMKSKDKSLSIFGVHKLEITETKKILYYIPLLIIIVIQPIIGGINTNLLILDVLLIFLFSFFVGYTEEFIFRGIIKEKLQSKGNLFFIIFSSTFFGILHMANAFSGDQILFVIMQVINAFFIGIILALLVTVVNNIVPLIVFHFLYDALAQITNKNTYEKELMVVILLNIIYFIYGIYLLYILLNKKNSLQK